MRFYSLHGDTIKSFQKNYIIQELTDSTLVLQYLPESLTIGVTPVRCTTDNSVQGQGRTKNAWIVFGVKRIFGIKVLLK